MHHSRILTFFFYLFRNILKDYFLVDYYEEPRSLLPRFCRFWRFSRRKQDTEENEASVFDDINKPEQDSLSNENDVNIIEMVVSSNSQNKINRLADYSKGQSDSEIPKRKSKLAVYLKRYDSFIKSPRVHFVYDTLFYTIFLLLFSYMLLCDLNYYAISSEEEIVTTNGTLNTTANMGNSTYNIKKQVQGPSSVEYILIFWIIMFIGEELSQVSS